MKNNPVERERYGQLVDTFKRLGVAQHILKWIEAGNVEGAMAGALHTICLLEIEACMMMLDELKGLINAEGK